MHTGLYRNGTVPWASCRSNPGWEHSTNSPRRRLPHLDAWPPHYQPEEKFGLDYSPPMILAGPGPSLQIPRSRNAWSSTSAAHPKSSTISPTTGRNGTTSLPIPPVKRKLKRCGRKCCLCCNAPASPRRGLCAPRQSRTSPCRQSTLRRRVFPARERERQSGNGRSLVK